MNKTERQRRWRRNRREVWQAQKNRYYGRRSQWAIREGEPWEQWEDNVITWEPRESDTIIGQAIGRSVRAIQVRRSRLRRRERGGS